MARIGRIKGTQDFLDLSLFNFIVHECSRHIQQYNFTHIATPLIEPIHLFIRSLGEHTDVVTKEMFVIEKGNHSEDICLRPEATASTVRAFIEHNPSTPWKVFSYGPMFRYERPQKGRFRQFHQVNMEIIGSKAIAQDAQLITMLDRLFHETFKLQNYSLQINFVGTVEDRATYQEQLKSFLDSFDAAGICDTCLVRKEKNILRVFDCKNESCQKIYEKAPHIVDHLSEPSKKEWEQLKKELNFLSVTFAYNPKLVRGLDYYHKTVFEFVSDNLGAQNAFCGGGRYDQLVKQLGAGKDYPSVGAAIGIERLLLLLEPIRDTLLLPELPKLCAVMPLSSDQESLALLVSDALYAAGLTVETMLEGDSIKNMMRRANKIGATYALILGENEQANKTVVVKNMETGEQQEVGQVDLVGFLK